MPMIDLFLGFGVIVAYIYNIYISFGIVNIPYIREPLRPETLEPFLVHQANHISVSYNPEPNMVDGAGCMCSRTGSGPHNSGCSCLCEQVRRADVVVRGLGIAEGCP